MRTMLRRVRRRRADPDARAGIATPSRDARRVRVNGSFRGQQLTGQQRYATEVAMRLDLPEVRPSARVGRSRVLTWLWAQSLGLGRRGTTLLTMTSRGPIVALNQAVVVHDLFVFDHREWYSTAYVLTHKFALYAQIRLATHVFAVSEPVADHITKRFRVRRPVVVAPNAPATQFHPPVDSAETTAEQRWLRDVGLEPAQYLFAVGSADPRKNTGRIVEAHTSLPAPLQERYPLALAGAQNSNFARVADQVQDTRVVRLGYVTDAQLVALYRHARLVLFPSLDEGFGLPAAEALACGTEVLVSDNAVMRWVCGGDAHYTDPFSAHEISTKLQEILHKTPPSASLAHAVAERMRSRFSWAVTARTIEDTLLRAETPHSPRAPWR